MLSTVTIFFLALPLYWVFTIANGLRKNVALAKKSGLPYILVPASGLHPVWLLTGRPIVTWYVQKYPDSEWTNKYLLLLLPEWTWRFRYAPFARHGDTFLTVSPQGLQLWTASREVISQITTRRDDFPKPAWMYRSVNIFGRNVVTSEGSEWKFHRKVTSPSFGEKNNFLVWEESLRQGKQLMKSWAGADGRGNFTVEDISENTMRLSLNVISKAGFGVAVQWPGESATSDDIRPLDPESNYQHELTFKDALANLLHSLLLIVIAPDWLLRKLPFKFCKSAHQALMEYKTYMDELFAVKVKEALAGEKAEGMDIMGALVKNSYGPETRLEGNAKQPGEDLERQHLTDSEIKGNAFVFLLAGHETSAGALHYSLIFLAMNPLIQRHLQEDIDAILGDRNVEEWDYNKDCHALQNSMVGAVMMEQLRLVPPVLNIPKSVTEDRDQMLNVDGRKVILPKGTLIALCSIGVHRNPKYWPSTGPSKKTDADNDLDDFVPERWLVHDEEGKSDDAQEGIEHEGRTRLFQPLKSAYIPFSDGPRSCLGKRFAQVEIMVLLAFIFKTYSVELAVDKQADDETVERMSNRERKELYEKQMHIANRTVIEKSSTRITIQIRGATVPIRLIPRGREKFLNLF